MIHGENISVIIPTLNRSDHVAKMLFYFQYVGFRGTVLLGDSSTGEHLEKTKRSIARLDGAFPVVHNLYPNKKAFECIRDMVGELKTPYALWMCDDDILIPNTLVKAAAFLDAHPDYSGVGGVALRYALINSGAFGAIASVARYAVRSVEEETARDRLSHLLSHYSVISYSLHRTDQLKKRFSIPRQEGMSDVTFATELFPTCMVAVQGKVAMLPDLFVVRQIHAGRYILPDVFDWFTKRDWQSSYQVFASELAEALVGQDGRTREQAEEGVKRAFWDYLQQRMSEKFERKYSPPHRMPRSVLKRLVRHVPGAGRFTNVIKGRDAFSLPALLHPRSPYHEDFMPVYRAVVDAPKDHSLLDAYAAR